MADAFRQDQLDFPVQSIVNHAVKALALSCAGSRYALVTVNPDKLPVAPGLDVFRVVIALSLVRTLLFILVSRNPRIGGYRASEKVAFFSISSPGILIRFSSTYQ